MSASVTVVAPTPSLSTIKILRTSRGSTCDRAAVTSASAPCPASRWRRLKNSRSASVEITRMGFSRLTQAASVARSVPAACAASAHPNMDSTAAAKLGNVSAASLPGGPIMDLVFDFIVELSRRAARARGADALGRDAERDPVRGEPSASRGPSGAARGAHPEHDAARGTRFAIANRAGFRSAHRFRGRERFCSG